MRGMKGLADSAKLALENSYVLYSNVVNGMHVVVFYDGIWLNANISCKKGWPYSHHVFGKNIDELVYHLEIKLALLSRSMREVPDYE